MEYGRKSDERVSWMLKARGLESLWLHNPRGREHPMPTSPLPNMSDFADQKMTRKKKKNPRRGWVARLSRKAESQGWTARLSGKATGWRP